MKSREFKILSTSIVFLFTAGLLTACGGKSEENTADSKEVLTQPIQSVETIIEPEPITNFDEVEEITTFDGLDLNLEEETASMEGILDDISDSASNVVDETEKAVGGAVDSMKSAVEDNIATAQDAAVDIQKEATGVVESAIVEPVAAIIEDAEETVTATPNLIRQVQQALTNAGYKPGPADGISGPRTLNAIKSFQQDNNLASGELTKETLRALGVDY